MQKRGTALSTRTKILIGLFIAAGVFDLVSILCTPFADWFIDTVFPLFTEGYGRLTSLASFSVGEVLIAAAVLLLALLLVLLVLLVFLFRRRGYRRFVTGYVRFILWVVCIVFLEMSMTCVVLYHATPLEESLTGYGKDYDVSDLTALRDALVAKCNGMAEGMPRDAAGNLIAKSDESVQEKAREAVRNLSSTFPRLSGFQVRPKAMFSSVLLCQGYMQGYYFPFTMEANYNSLMEPMKKPFTMCHEIVHTHGYLYEDEANLLGCLACVESGDTYFQYSGYLGILNYVNNAFYDAVSEETYWDHVEISDAVWKDAEFVSDETWEMVDAVSPFDTDNVHEAVDTSLDATLKANGVADGSASYNHVVELLLMYYDGDLTSFS